MSDDIAELIAQIRALAQEQQVTNDILRNSIAPQLEALRDSDKRHDRTLADHANQIADLTIAVHALETGAPKPKPRKRK